MPPPLTIDLEGGKGYAGLGDIAMLAWLAEGCRRHGRTVRFHRTRNLDLAELFGLSIEPQPGGITLDAAYTAELADRGRRPRLDYIRDFLGVTAPPCRPTVRVPADDLAWAADRLREFGRPPVVLFPQTAWVPREWPASCWVDLAWGLKAAGVPVVVLMSPKDERLSNTPLFWWGVTLARVAALMEVAGAVVGNDSFPAHLAAAVGVPTVAVMGPTRPTVFSHASNVECVSSGAIDCTGCHFGPPFRAACDQGCQSLFRLDPGYVKRRVLDRLEAAAGNETAPGR